MYEFDPSYGFSEEQLLCLGAPHPPKDFDEFWQKLYKNALQVKPQPQVQDTGKDVVGWRAFDLKYLSTDNFQIGGWLCIPSSGVVKRGLVVGHGYGGRAGPDFHFPFAETVLLFPCFRGIGRSAHGLISEDPYWHVQHNIQNRDQYILRGCVEDLWLGVSALLRLFPQVENRIGYLGISFGGGIGAMACAFDSRIQRCHFNVPTFGNQLMRLFLPTLGSGRAIQDFYHKHPKTVLQTLRYFDSAVAAQFLKQPTHVACALYDPCVAPPGQFAVYNHIAGPKQLFVLEAGHHEYPTKLLQEAALMQELNEFFHDL